jgi:methylthioribose-1-phosphate isomerase
VLAKENGIPFYVAAPTSTIDLSLTSGEGIPIEERSPAEVTSIGGVRLAPKGIKAAIITEKGIVRELYLRSLKKLLIGG